MGVLETLHRKLSDRTSAVYECCLCATRFERRPLNCPACGSTDIEES